ncbi:Hypothetical predicted protein [Cloeon dipterum]|uniref:Uncharacterized protein n=1 Tax=Cloeon dipterum TaxID=197152 RepID=A0A8S1DWD2_9INSE|nr:Hypothetical predicted protein [Cloeon dipterum]
MYHGPISFMNMVPAKATPITTQTGLDVQFTLLCTLTDSSPRNVRCCGCHVSPASVTYLSGPAPIGLRAGPATYTYSPSAYAAPAAYAAHATFAAPATYAAPVAQYTPSYVKAVQHVHHVPAVTNVPIKTYHHTPALIQKTVDVARPAVQTRKFELRRPAIQKQFYDIEERVIVRPAGSALVELDEPISKTQKGSAVISPLATVPVHTVPAYAHYPVAGYPTYTPEIEVVEPATKIHRVTYQQPTYIKTARLGVARVATSVPVYTKSLQAHPIAYY